MSLPENWTQLVEHDREAIQYHESWVIICICSNDQGKTIQPHPYNDIPEGWKCYPYFLLCKPTHRGYSGKSEFVGKEPQEGAVIKGLFGNYKVVHVWNNRIELGYDLLAHAASEADRLSIKETMMRSKECT